MWTKKQLISLAFEELGISNYIFDISQRQWDSALSRMDAMVAGWNANGVRISYPLPSSPDSSSIDTQAYVPDYSIEAIVLGLACRLAPSYGKAVTPETKAFADMAYSNMLNQAAQPTPVKQLPHELARGAGTKPWRNYNNPYINKPTDPVLAGGDGQIDLQG